LLPAQEPFASLVVIIIVKFWRRKLKKKKRKTLHRSLFEFELQDKEPLLLRPGGI
jgi:hypothetical protein